MEISDRDRKLLIGVGAGVVVLILIWFLFLRGGGSPAPPPAPGGAIALGGRDPFSPLPASPSPSAGESPTSPSPSPSCKNSTTINGDTITLNDILKNSNVKVKDNSTNYTVAPGGTFAKWYTVTAVAGATVDFKYEKKNDSQSFQLCIKA